VQSEYLDHDAIGLAELVRTGQVSARELIDTAIARAEAVNPAINAIVLKDYQAARNRASRSGFPADAPLAGVPYLIKDLGAPVAGLRMSMGSRHFQHYIPREDSPIVARSKAAGLNIFGKTNTPEIGQMPYTEPELFGPTRNPITRRAAQAAARQRPLRAASFRWRTRPTAAVRSAFRRRAVVCSATSPPTMSSRNRCRRPGFYRWIMRCREACVIARCCST
jgi:amidase